VTGNKLTENEKKVLHDAAQIIFRHRKGWAEQPEPVTIRYDIDVRVTLTAIFHT